MHPHSNVGEGRRLQRKHGALSKERKMNFSLHTKKKVVKIFKNNKGAVVAYFCVDWYIGLRVDKWSRIEISSSFSHVRAHDAS